MEPEHLLLRSQELPNEPNKLNASIFTHAIFNALFNIIHLITPCSQTSSTYMFFLRLKEQASHTYKATGEL
jgi:hypothetical protein